MVRNVPRPLHIGAGRRRCDERATIQIKMNILMYRSRCYIKAILFIYCVVYFSCNEINSPKTSTNNHYGNFQILIISPFSCYNEIRLDSSGHGTNIYGISHLGETDTIKTQKDIYIEPDSDKKEINELVYDLKSRLPLQLSSKYWLDSYHFTLTIDGKKFIDKYRQDSLLDQVLKILVTYLQNDENGDCDFFNGFKRTLQ